MINNLKLIIILILARIAASWVTLGDIRTGRVLIVEAPTTQFVASDSKLSFNVSYSSDLATNPVSAGLGITGLDTLVTNDLAVNLTIENYTSVRMWISAEVFGDTICTHLAVNYIAMGEQALSFTEVMLHCYLMEQIDVGNDTRTESRTQQTYLSANVLQSSVHLTGFSIHNSQGINNYLQVTSTIPTGSSTVEYVFTTAQNNTVNHICITTIIFCESCTQIYYYYWGEIGREVIQNSTNPQGVLDPKQRYEKQDRMFYGMSALNISRAYNRIYDMDTTQYADLDVNYVANYGVYEIAMDYYFIVKRFCNDSEKYFNVSDQKCMNNCPDTNLETDIPDEFCAPNCYYWCQQCDGSLPQNCTLCNATKFRVDTDNDGTCDCQPGYVDIGTDFREQRCYACDYFIPGCAICTTPSLCLECQPGYVIDNNAKCACTSGYLISGLCTNITGCVSAIQYSGTIRCVACNESLHFIRPNDTYTCQCETGYYINSTFRCNSVCGDAIMVEEEECDDGNTVSGDGCSSFCVVQDKFACFNGSLTSASVCLIKDSFSLTVKYVRRILTGNIMQVGILVEPQHPNLTQTNFKKYLVHNVPSTNYNATYQDGMLILDFQYTQTIEDNDFDLELSFDPNIFDNTTVSTVIPASGMNAKLTYDEDNESNFPLEVLIIILDVIAVIIFIVSAGISERMIGLECIQVLQAVLFLQTTMHTTPSTLAPLQKLEYASGFNDVFGIDYSRTYTFSFSLSSIGLQKQFFLSANLMVCILLGVIIVGLIIKILQKVTVSSIEKAIYEEQRQKLTQKYVKITKAFNFIFERLIFVFGLLIMFLSIFAIMLQTTDMSADTTLVSKQFNMLIGVLTVSIVAGLIALICVSTAFPSTKLFPIWTKQWYPMIYLIYQATFIMVLAFIYTQFYILYICISLTVFFLIINIIYRPYFERSHNIALIFNQLVILVAEGVFLYEKLTTEENQTFFKIMAWVITVCLYLVVAVTIYRIFTYRKVIEEFREIGKQAFQEDNPGAFAINVPSYNYLNNTKQMKTLHNSQLNKETSSQRKRKKKEMKSKLNNDSKITQPNKNTTLQELNWKNNEPEYDQAIRPQNFLRAPPTKRNEKFDSSRLDLDKTDSKRGMKEDPGESNLNSYRNQSKLKNKYAQEEQDEDPDELYDHVGQSPYNENGTISSKKKDPLDLIRLSLKKDFNDKLKGETSVKKI